MADSNVYLRWFYSFMIMHRNYIATSHVLREGNQAVDSLTYFRSLRIFRVTEEICYDCAELDQ